MLKRHRIRPRDSFGVTECSEGTEQIADLTSNLAHPGWDAPAWNPKREIKLPARSLQRSRGMLPSLKWQRASPANVGPRLRLLLQSPPPHLSLQADRPRRTPRYLGVFRVGLGVARKPEAHFRSLERHFSPKLGGRLIYTQRFKLLKYLACSLGQLTPSANRVRWC